MSELKSFKRDWGIVEITTQGKEPRNAIATLIQRRHITLKFSNSSRLEGCVFFYLQSSLLALTRISGGHVLQSWYWFAGLIDSRFFFVIGRTLFELQNVLLPAVLPPCVGPWTVFKHKNFAASKKREDEAQELAFLENEMHFGPLHALQIQNNTSGFSFLYLFRIEISFEPFLPRSLLLGAQKNWPEAEQGSFSRELISAK